MATALKLTAKKRTIIGRKVKQLRRQKLLPGNVFGKDVKSLSVELPLKEFETVFKTAGETNIIELLVEKEAKPRPVLIGKIQVDPVSDVYLHVDFRQVDLSKKVTVAVPVELKGEAPAVVKGGVLVKLINEVEIEVLPKDWPDRLSLDVSGLEEVGQGLSLKDIKVDAAKVKLVADNLDELVVKIEAPAKEEEVAPAPVVEAAPAEAPAVAKASVGEEEKKPAPDQDKKPAPKKA